MKDRILRTEMADDDCPDESEAEETEVRRCLNCGMEVNGNFCSNCGQRADTARFTGKTFMKCAGTEFTRMSTAFVRTSWRLLACPWDVIRDYVYGRRVGLVSPVNMFLVLSLYIPLFLAVISWFSDSQEQRIEVAGGGWFLSLLESCYNSFAFKFMILAIPMAYSTYLVYRKDIKGKFNFAEIMIAAIYMACTYRLLRVIFKPLNFISNTFEELLFVVAIAVYCVLSLNKAFPQPSKKRTVSRLILWVLIGFLFTILLVLPIVILPVIPMMTGE